MRLVIADDEVTTRRLLRALLAVAGHEVLEAADGETAWKLLHQEDAALLITDWHMPGLDGRGLVERIRASERPGYIYVILLTSRDSKAEIVSGLASGADDYLTKPFHPEELRARVAIGMRMLALEARLREARDAFAHQASHDPLTGLLNRLAITTHVQAELSRANRASYPLSLALIDLDYFKAVNDTHGHQAGDQALRHVAQLLAQTVRPYDWVGRWGGEEFLVVLSNTTMADAASVAERLRSQIAASPLMLPDGTSLALSVSIGLACTELAEPTADPSLLFRTADAALYTAKRAGRNQVHPTIGT